MFDVFLLPVYVGERTPPLTVLNVEVVLTVDVRVSFLWSAAGVDFRGVDRGRAKFWGFFRFDRTRSDLQGGHAVWRTEPRGSWVW
jgi:hypothetical protein